MPFRYDDAMWEALCDGARTYAKLSDTVDPLLGLIAVLLICTLVAAAGAWRPPLRPMLLPSSPERLPAPAVAE